MKEIIEALEAAIGPDRSIDGMIAHAVNLHMPDDPEGWPLRYTESIDAAMTLVPDGHLWKCGYSRFVPHVAEIVDYDLHRGTFVGECDSNRAIALCIAALKARSLPAI